MIPVAARVAQHASRSVVKQQRRGFVDYLVKYPDKVMETKKLQMKGGTEQGAANPTWLKQPGDYITAGVGLALCGFATINLLVGHWRLATGKGKID